MQIGSREHSAHSLRLLGRWGQANQGSVTIGAAAFCVLVGLLDYASGDLVSPNIFYVLPVVAATAAAGIRAGLLMIGVATASGYLAAATGIDNPSQAIIAWNLAARIVFLLGAVWLIDALGHTLEQLEAQATTDPLTGVLNRRALYELSAREMARCERTTSPMTVAYFDLDGLKSVNDTIGHDAGDEVIITFVEEVRSRCRASDLFARLGGDEFALVLPGLAPSEAEAVVRRIQASLDARGCSASAGIVLVDTSVGDLEPALQRADILMYEAKQGGGGVITGT